MLTNTTEIGTARLPLRRVTIPALTAVPPSSIVCRKRPFTTHADRRRQRIEGGRLPADLRTHPGRAQGRADATVAVSSRISSRSNSAMAASHS